MAVCSPTRAQPDIAGVSELARRGVGFFFSSSLLRATPASSCTPRARAVLSPASPCLVWQGASITTSFGHWALDLIDRLPCLARQETRHQTTPAIPMRDNHHKRFAPKAEKGGHWPELALHRVRRANPGPAYGRICKSSLLSPQGEKIANSSFMQLPAISGDGTSEQREIGS